MVDGVGEEGATEDLPRQFASKTAAKNAELGAERQTDGTALVAIEDGCTQFADS
jgi:hypothetical protein